MKATTRFSLERHAGPYGSWPPRTRLRVDGRPTRLRVAGYSLLHQFAVEDGYLLVTDHDCPFEEVTVFTLLSPELRVLSARTVGAPYNPFLLTRQESTGTRHLVAWFGEDYPMRITIRKWGIPLLHKRIGLQRIRG